MLKQILSLSTAIAMCMTLSATAFALDGHDGEGATPTTTAADTVYIEGINHTVVAGDTLGHLSVNYFGNYNYHRVLYAVNEDVFAQSNGVMYPGMLLFIPDAIGDVTRHVLPVAGEDEALYTAKGGDTLGSIAQEQYPNILNGAELIFERNNDCLPTIHTLYEGQIIVLPVIEYTEAVAAPTAYAGGYSAVEPGTEG